MPSAPLGDNAAQALNWDSVLEELASLPQEYREVKFHPLKQVVEIFSSPDPQGLRNEVRDTGERLGLVLDQVVSTYYSGFARSIQNYSHILQLFTDSKEQAASLKQALGDSYRQLGAHSHLLLQQWHKVLALQASTALLTEAQRLAELPSKIELALTQNDLPAAVEYMLQGMNALTQPNLRQIPALSYVHRDLRSLSAWLCDTLCVELQARIYSDSQSMHADFPNTTRDASVHPAGANYGLAGALHSLRPSSRTAAQQHGGAATPTSVVGQQGRSGGAARLRVFSTSELVGFLTRVRGVPLAKARVAKEARMQVRKLLLASVAKHKLNAAGSGADSADAAASYAHLGLPGSLLAAGSGGEGGLESPGLPGLGPSLKAQAQASAIVSGCVQDCLRVLSRARAVLDEVAAVPVAGGDMGLAEAAALRADGEDSDRDDGRPPKDSQRPTMGPEYAKRAHADICITVQEELQQLLECLLRAGPGGPVLFTKQPLAVDVASKGFLEGLADMVERAAEVATNKLGDVLTTTFAPVLPKGVLPNSAAAGNTGGSSASGPSSSASGAVLPHMPGVSLPGGGGAAAAAQAQAAQERRGNEASKVSFKLDITFTGTVQAAAEQGSLLYRSQDATHLQAVTEYEATLHAALGIQAGSPYFGPHVFRHILRLAASAQQYVTAGDLANQGGVRLKAFLDQFMAGTFLPMAWVELRGRATAALQEPSAFMRSDFGLINQQGLMAAAMAGGGGIAGSSNRMVLPVALLAGRILGQVCSWWLLMPSFEVALVAMAVDVLGQLVDGLQVAISGVLAGSAAGALACRQDVAVVMAYEPDAQLLGDAGAFFVAAPGLVAPQGGGGKGGGAGGGGASRVLAQGDMVEYMLHLKRRDWRPVLVSSLTRPTNPSAGQQGRRHHHQHHHNQYSESALAEVEVALLCYRDRPTSPDQLMMLSADSRLRLQQLASLHESLEYMAAAVAKQLRGVEEAGHAASGDTPALIMKLQYRCKGLAGQCLRAMRLELMLLSAYQLASLSALSHTCQPEDVQELPPSVGYLVRAVGQAADALLPCLSAARASYVFGGVASVVPRLLMWQLSDIHTINSYGVERMLRMLTVLQPQLTKYAEALVPLLSLVTSGSVAPTALLPQVQGAQGQGSAGGKDKTAAFDLAREYYNLLTATPAEVVQAAAERPFYFLHPEWLALFQVRMAQRPVPEAQVSALQRSLDRSYGLTAGYRVAGMVGSMVSAVQVPAEKIKDTLVAGKDTLLAGVIAGKDTLLAGVRIPAQQLQKVFNKIAHMRSLPRNR